MIFRDRESGNIIGPAHVRRLADQRRKPTEMTYLAADPSNWTAGDFDKAEVDPVQETDKPSFDPFFERLDGNQAELVDGQYHRVWQVKSKFGSDTELRQAMINHIQNLSRQHQRKGITVGGMPVGTDSDSIARVTAAQMKSRTSRKWVVNGQVYDLSDSDIQAIYDAVEAHIQGCLDNEAALIDQVNTVADPRNEVDMEAGWPDA